MDFTTCKIEEGLAELREMELELKRDRSLDILDEMVKACEILNARLLSR